MTYIDGFVAAVPTADRDAYLAHARAAAAVFLENGATRCVECWGDDVKDGKVTDSAGPSRRRTTRRWCSPGSSIPIAPAATGRWRR